MEKDGFPLFREDRNIQAVKARKEAFHVFGDGFTSPDLFAFDVKGHIGIVEGHAQEGPAAVEYEADAFVRRFGNGNALFFGRCSKALRTSAP